MVVDFEETETVGQELELYTGTETVFSDRFTTTLEKLCEPFPVEDIQWLPKGQPQVNMAFAYVDVWGYKDRLDQYAPSMWTEKQPVVVTSADKVFVSVEITLFGRQYGGLGEEKLSNENAGTVAYSQAFRRACANFGMGRYMYDFGTTWITPEQAKAMQQEKYKGANTIGLRMAVEAYRKAGIPIDEKYANVKIVESKLHTPSVGAAITDTNRAGTASAPGNATASADTAVPSGIPTTRPATSSGEGSIGKFSSKQLFHLRRAGFDDGELTSALLQNSARRVTDMVIGSKMTKDAVLAALSEEDNF